MSIVSITNGYKEEVDKELVLFFEQEASNPRFSKEMIDSLADFTVRAGGRIRAAMLYHGYACFEEPSIEIIRASMSMELLQSYFLIHDDIMDKDDTRRGGDTIHKKYEKEYDDEEVGRNIAILIGDLAGALVYKPILNANLDPDLKNKAVICVSDFIREVLQGQELDYLSGFKTSATEEEILRLHELKTASYTIDGPLRCGAILAGASDVSQLSEYGIPLGIAYQLKDDIKCIFDDRLDKEVGSDIGEGKKTLLIIKALESDNEHYRRIISDNLGIENPDLEAVKDVMRETGSLDYSKRKIKELTAQSLMALERLNIRKEGRDFLKIAAEYVANVDVV